MEEIHLFLCDNCEKTFNFKCDDSFLLIFASVCPCCYGLMQYKGKEHE